MSATPPHDHELEVPTDDEATPPRADGQMADTGQVLPTPDSSDTTTSTAADAQDPWGRAEPPAVADEDLSPLPPALAAIEAMLEAGDERSVAWSERQQLPGVEDLPEVRAMAADGWEPVPTGPGGSQYALLPAVWPREHRRWVRDRMPRYQLMQYDDDHLMLGPEMGGHRHERWLLARQARSFGLPPPPAGRLWLLRSPWPSLRVSSLLLLVGQHRDRCGLGWDALATMRAAQDLLPRTEEEVWSLWTGRQAEAARGWAETGTRGRDVDAWIRLGLGPEHVASLVAPVDDGGAGLTPEQARRWCEVTCMRDAPGDEIVNRTVAWRQIGLAADAPVEQLGMVLLDGDPDDVARWLAAGLTAEAVAVWQADDLERALLWHVAGFAPREARQLVEADPTLTAEEASAFAVLGIAPAARVRWVACGFSAAEARAWTDLDIVASEARVWRAMGRDALEAGAQRAAGGPPLPTGVELGWAATGPGRDHVDFGVTDPPGTRGSVANAGHEQVDLS